MAHAVGGFLLTVARQWMTNNNIIIVAMHVIITLVITWTLYFNTIESQHSYIY